MFNVYELVNELKVKIYDFFFGLYIVKNFEIN